MTPSRNALALSLLAVFGGTAPRSLGATAFQCPDGSPPPCRAAAPARRPNPPLDERTWIVVPFENVARAADIEWLREASVNLLYLDLSRWRDIRVVDDERVADLMREVPEARGGQSLSLQAGLAVARRAGAGKLVMGDLLKVGARTQVVAKVFDVRTGERLRSVRQESAVADSLIPAFGRLAQGILNVAPPEGAALGAVGTTSVAAYQEYLGGVAAMNRWDLRGASTRFARAIELDTAFALAHYKLSIVVGWDSPNNPTRMPHSQAAVRLSTTLPQRERTLIAGLNLFNQEEYGQACEAYGSLVRADSSDIEALYGVGECTYHDPVVLPVAGDSTRFRFRSSQNRSLWAFRRVLELDPTYHLAFGHILDALTGSARAGCRPAGTATRCAPGGWVAATRREADTLVHEPTNTNLDGGSAYAAQLAEARNTRAYQRNLADAQAAAQRWVESGPGEPRALIALGRTLLLQGRVAEAQAQFSQVRGPTSTFESARFVVDQIDAAVKLGRMADAVRLYDSARVALDAIPGAGQQSVLLGAVFGRVFDADTMVRRILAAQSPPAVQTYFAQALRAATGVAPDSAVAAERALWQLAVAGQGPARSTSLIAGTAVWGLRLPRESWLPLDSGGIATDPRLKAVASLAAGDTSGFRRRVTSLDSTVAAEPPGANDGGSALFLADAWLVLGDSARALGVLRRFFDRHFLTTPLGTNFSNGFASNGMLWPRMMLLRADLAAAAGQPAEARLWYGRFADLWSTADPAAQPMVARARAASQ